MRLRILTPDRLLFEGDVTGVTLPGSVSPFTVLEGHAPIISSLEAGKLVVKSANGVCEYTTSGGFVQVERGEVTVCIEQ